MEMCAIYYEPSIALLDWMKSGCRRIHQIRNGIPLDISMGMLEVYLSGLPPKTKSHQEVFMCPAEFVKNRTEDRFYTREVEQYSSTRIRKDNACMGEFLQTQGYEMLPLPQTSTGFYWHMARLSLHEGCWYTRDIECRIWSDSPIMYPV
jgi:hypothetical protein